MTDVLATALDINSPVYQGSTLTDYHTSNNIPAWVAVDDGAPAAIRGAVGGVSNPGDQVRTLQLHYPMALTMGQLRSKYQQMGGDWGAMSPDAENELVFFDGNRWRMYNAPGFSGGDVMSFARDAFQGIGSSLGAMGGGAVGGPGGAVVGAGAGGAAGGAVWDTAMELTGTTVDTRPLGERALQYGADFFLEAAGEGVGGFISNRLGRLFARPGAGDRLRTFEAAGIRPTAGAVSGGNMVSGIEAAVRDLPGGGAVRDALNRTIGTVETRLSDIAHTYGSATTFAEGGTAIARGADTYFTANSIRESLMFEDVSRGIGPGTAFPATNTISALQGGRYNVFNQGEVTFEGMGTTFGPDVFGVIANRLAEEGSGNLTYAQMNFLRQEARSRAHFATIMADPNQADWRALYNGLTQDMRAAAMASGPEAMEAFGQAQLFSAQFHGEMENFMSHFLMDQRRGTTNQSIFERLWRGGRPAEEVITRLRTNIEQGEALFQGVSQADINNYLAGLPPDVADRIGQRIASMAPEERQLVWGDVASTALLSMGISGQAAEGEVRRAFSIDKFLSTWTGLTPTARDRLFSGTQFEGLREQIDRLANVMTVVRGSPSFRNSSGTGQRGFYIDLLVGGLGGLGSGDVVTAATAAMVSNFARRTITPAVAARLLTSERFMRWMAESSEQIYNGGSVAGALARLAAITSDADEGFAVDAMEYLTAVEHNLAVSAIEGTQPSAMERMQGPAITSAAGSSATPAGMPTPGG
jgi:hypothetical protein